MFPTLILGAGLAGLSCAYHLRRPYILAEKEAHVGGTARTIERNGFLFDCTGHWLHLKDATLRVFVDKLLPDELVTCERRASIYSHGMLTPYPFQAHTFGLPPDVVAECVLGYFKAREDVARGVTKPPQSFGDYIRQCMGEGIAKHFMMPYNSKLWTVSPDEMAHAWCGRFVPIPTPEEVVHGALSPAGTGRAMGYNATFLYPKTGGIGRLSQALADALESPPRCNAGAVKIDWLGRCAQLADGTVVAYENLVSTAPVPSLLALMRNVPEAVMDAASRLRATTVTYWDIGLKRPNGPQDPHWIYYPEMDIPFYRAGSASAVLPSMAPPGHSSLYVETAHPQGTSCGTSDEMLLQALRRVGLLAPEEEPLLCVRNEIPCAYTIMDSHYGEARETVLAWLASVDIHSTGRYGSWIYDSMEGAMLQGKALAERLSG